MAIESRAVGKGKGPKPKEQSKEKGVDNAHLEEMVKHMKDEDAEESGKESSGEQGTHVGAVEDLPFLVVREKVLQEVFGYGERWHGHERKTWCLVDVVMATVKGPVTGIYRLHFFCILFIIIYLERAVVYDGTGEANPHILVPSPTLEKIGVTYKKKDKQD